MLFERKRVRRERRLQRRQRRRQPGARASSGGGSREEGGEGREREVGVESLFLSLSPSACNNNKSIANDFQMRENSQWRKERGETTRRHL